MTFPTFMVKIALSEQKKTYVDKSGPFDRERDLMSLQDSLIPPLKPQARKTGGLLITDQEALSSSEDFVFRYRAPRTDYVGLKATLDRRKTSLKRLGGGGL